MRDHNGKLGRYLEELKRSNASSTFELVTNLTISRNPPVFKGFFVCFEGLRLGLLGGCRPFICLDGCFLKTFLGGMLLAAVGRYGNDQMFPLDWAVVEGETNDSWDWFMSQL